MAKMNNCNDVTLVVEGKKLACSKGELAQYSDYFKAMFEGNFSEKDKDVITINGVDFRSLRTCLKMMGNKDFLPSGDLLTMLQTACMLQFDKIIDIIGDRLLHKINVSNCLDVWFQIEPHSFKLLILTAKKIALSEFDALQAKGHLLKLTTIHKYLANVQLICNERDVFFAFMEWHYKNSKNNVMEVLACLDFNRLSINDIAEILMHRDVKRSSALVNVLKSVIAIKKGESVEDDLAHKLINCNRRGYWSKPLFFGATDEGDDGEGFWRALNLWKSKFFNRNRVFKIIGHKQQIFLLGCQYGNTLLKFTVWIYDTVGKYWDQKNCIPGREEVETCIIDDIVYVVGGKGVKFEYKLRYDNMVMNVYKPNTWTYMIELPVWEQNLKCCNYMNQLFIFYNRLNCGYLYDHDSRTYVKLKIVNNKFLNIKDKFTLQCLNGSILIKDIAHLVELRVVEDTLHVEKISAVPSAYDVIDKSVLCYDTEYKIHEDRTNGLLTLESEIIYRDQELYRIGRIRHVFNTNYQLLLPDAHHSLSGKGEFVNTFENLFGKR